MKFDYIVPVILVNEFFFTFFNTAKMPCMCAAELTATGNPAIKGMYCNWEIPVWNKHVVSAIRN